MRLSLIIIFLSIVFSSCVKNKEKNFVDARDSFVGITIEENITICDGDGCFQRKFNSASSGAVIMFNGEKVVLTAAHSCAPKDLSSLENLVDGEIKIKTNLFGYDIHKMKHVFEIVKIPCGAEKLYNSSL